MPHLHMEYTANLTKLDIHKTLSGLNEALVASGRQIPSYKLEA